MIAPLFVGIAPLACRTEVFLVVFRSRRQNDQTAIFLPPDDPPRPGSTLAARQSRANAADTPARQRARDSTSVNRCNSRKAKQSKRSCDPDHRPSVIPFTAKPGRRAYLRAMMIWGAVIGSRELRGYSHAAECAHVSSYRRLCGDGRRR